MNFANWDWEVIVGFTAVLGFLWRQNRDMRSLEIRLTDQIGSLAERISNLAERVAKIEGALFYKLDVPEKKKSD